MHTHYGGISGYVDLYIHVILMSKDDAVREYEKYVRTIFTSSIT